jgi:hypothetical protein
MSPRRTWTEPLFTRLLMRMIGYEAWGRPEGHPPPYWASPSERDITRPQGDRLPGTCSAGLVSCNADGHWPRGQGSGYGAVMPQTSWDPSLHTLEMSRGGECDRCALLSPDDH